MPNKPAFNPISPQDLRQWLEQGRSFFLVDTLPADHFEKAHLPSAQHACVYEVEFLDRMGEISTDKTAQWVLYGSSPRSADAAAAAAKLHREGYGHVSVLTGGLEAWRLAGYALEGRAPDRPGDPQTEIRLADRVYRVDTDQSVIEWTGRNPNSRHFGTVAISAGEVAVSNGVMTGAFAIDMTAIKNINLGGDESQPVLVSHLKSDDFFFVSLFPSARFAIDRATPVAKPFVSLPNYQVEGTLEMRGVKAPQAFAATVTQTPEGNLSAEAHFDIDRTRWDIIYGSARFFEFLGMHLVFDLISVQIKIVAT